MAHTRRKFVNAQQLQSKSKAWRGCFFYRSVESGCGAVACAPFPHPARQTGRALLTHPCMQTFGVAKPFPSQNETPEIHVGQQRRDHRSLRAATMRVFGFVGASRLSVNEFDNGHLKPLLDQPQHPAIRDTPGQTLHQRPVWNRIEIVTKIRIDNVSQPNLCGVMVHLPHRFLGISTRSQIILRWLHIRFENRLE